MADSIEPCTSTEDNFTRYFPAAEAAESSLVEADSGTHTPAQEQGHPKDKEVLDLIDRYHTRRTTQWALFCWNSWRSEKLDRGSDQPVIPLFYDICDKSTEVLDRSLEKFAYECKNKEGKDYPAVTLQGIFFGLQRYMRAFCLSKNKKPVTFIKNEYQFPNSSEALKKRRKELAEIDTSKKTAHAVGITEKEEEYLWNIGKFGCNSAVALCNTVFFYIVKIYGIVCSTALRTMKTNTFVFGENEIGKYIELDTNFASDLDMYDQTSCCHNLSLLAQNTTSKLRHYCDESNPRTFYNILKYYVEIIKLVKSEESCLFLRPKADMAFSYQAIGRNQLQKKFGKMMKSANLKGYFTTQALVQSCLNSLQMKGYMVRKTHTFIPQHQVEICKILDPPTGILTTYDVKTKTTAILQLIKPSHSLPTQPVLDQNQVQYVYQVNQIQNLGNLLNAQQDLPKHDGNQMADRIQFLTPIQPCQNILPAGIPPRTSAAFVTGVSNLTNQLNAVNNMLPKVVSIAGNVPTATETVQGGTDNVEHTPKFPIPVFLEKVSQGKNNASLNDSGNDLDRASDNVVIKQEPTDYKSECVHTEDDSNRNQSEISRKRKTTDAVQDTSQNKIIKSADVHNFEEIKTRSKSNKLVDKDDWRKHEGEKNVNESETNVNESETNAYEGETNAYEGETKEVEEEGKELCEAQIEYSFSNDLSRKITKQEVSLKEDGQTMFNFSGTNKMGKSVGDLDINLGDYLPENCSIKPGDIDIKRIILSDGGKMVIKLKYTVNK